jgi:hypothetical protein
MDITVGIELVNDQDTEVTVELPVGTVIEVDTTGFQNVALSRRYTFVLPPRSTLRTPVEGVCLNRDLSPPNSVPGLLTPFRFDAVQIDQDYVWNRVSNPTSS